MSDSEDSHERALSGRVVVGLMFLLGIAATAFLWTYWTVRLTPFMPLQQALEQAFPDSSPRVEGGTLKKSGQSVLQVVMRSDFDPRSDAAATQIQQRLDTSRSLATDLCDLDDYEILAVHLYFPQKERGISQQTFFRDVKTWVELDSDSVIGWEPDPRRDTPPANEEQ